MVFSNTGKKFKVDFHPRFKRIEYLSLPFQVRNGNVNVATDSTVPPVEELVHLSQLAGCLFLHNDQSYAKTVSAVIRCSGLPLINSMCFLPATL